MPTPKAGSSLYSRKSLTSTSTSSSAGFSCFGASKGFFIAVSVYQKIGFFSSRFVGQLSAGSVDILAEGNAVRNEDAAIIKHLLEGGAALHGARGERALAGGRIDRQAETLRRRTEHFG